MLPWDGMGWAALVAQCISMDAFTHLVTSAAHPIPSHPILSQRVCECTITVRSYHTYLTLPDLS